MSSETGIAGASGEDVRAGHGMLIVVSSPSGGGKGTLIRRALQMVPNLGYSISWTTRQPRTGEQDGRDYYFVSPEAFEQMRAQNGFLEWALVHGNLYGTARAEVERVMAEGGDVVLEIDVQGAAIVHAGMKNTVSVFIIPPSFDVLRTRLAARNSEALPDLTLRLHNSRGEVERYREFDYVVLNDVADRAAHQLASIVYAERARRERQSALVRRVLETFPESSAETKQLRV